MITCPLGSYCPLAKLNETTGVCDPYSYQIPSGDTNHTCGSVDIWSGVVNNSNIFCSPGSYYPSPTRKVSCNEGYYCRMGSTHQNLCSKLSSCNLKTSNQKNAVSKIKIQRRIKFRSRIMNFKIVPTPKSSSLFRKFRRRNMELYRDGNLQSREEVERGCGFSNGLHVREAGVRPLNYVVNDPAKYFSILEAVGSVDMSVGIKMGVQYSIWGGSVINLGTKKHKDKYYDGIDSLEYAGVTLKNL